MRVATVARDDGPQRGGCNERGFEVSSPLVDGHPNPKMFANVSVCEVIYCGGTVPTRILGG